MDKSSILKIVNEEVLKEFSDRKGGPQEIINYLREGLHKAEEFARAKNYSQAWGWLDGIVEMAIISLENLANK